MDTKKIEEIIKLFEESKVSSMEVENKDLKIKLNKHCENEIHKTEKEIEKDKPAAKENVIKNKVIKSPIVGTFYSSSSPEGKPFVTEGSYVNEGDVICIVEAMKVMNEIRSDKNGVVKEIFVQNGQMVQFDEPLFALGESYDS